MTDTSDADREQDLAELAAMAKRAGLDVERDRLGLETYRALLYNVTGPDNPLWSVQVAMARHVVASGAISAAELLRYAQLTNKIERDARLGKIEPDSATDT